jgi:transcriptional regulator GlxA family with amidase domain
MLRSCLCQPHITMLGALGILSRALDLRAWVCAGWTAARETRIFLTMAKAKLDPSQRLIFLRDRGSRTHEPRRAHASLGQASAHACDPQVERAIALMHQSLGTRWTVTMLARKVGLSRPAFARRFVASTGHSPLKYLTRLRMERAARLLHSSPDALAQVGEQVGYESEFAFNRAFKRHHGLSPGGFRRAVRLGSAPVFRAAA